MPAHSGETSPPVGSGPLEQHFLDPDVADRLVADAAIGPDDVVLDVGAGTGALTAAIARRKPRLVIAVEPDRRCHAALAALADRPVPIMVRPERIQDLESAELSAVTMIIANPPFSVLEHVIRLGRTLPRLRAVHLCVGRRWARAAVAPPGPDYSIISLAVQADFVPVLRGEIPGMAFSPPIAGSACWLRLLPRADPDPVIILLNQALLRHSQLRVKEFVRSPKLRHRVSAARIHRLRQDTVVRRLQQVRLAALDRSRLSALVEAIRRSTTP